MKRLVYAPKIEAWVKADSGIYNLTEFITDFSIDRKVNAVSSAELTLRNPNKVWTNNVYKDAITGEQKIGPILHPMDPITIFLTRLQNRPVQVFTGFCDSTPYLQLFPGTVQLKASCTLKKLLYTYFDSGLPFMREYLSNYGWAPTGSGSIVHPEAEGNAISENEPVEGTKGQKVRYDDSGIGELLYHVLKDIGGWPDDAIYIQEIPSSVIELVSNLFDLFKAEGEEAAAELKGLLSKIIGQASVGSGGTTTTNVGNVGSGEAPASGEPCTAIDVGRAMLSVGFKADPVILAKGMTTVKHESNFGSAPGWDEEHTGGVLGYWQIQQSSHPTTSAECCMNLMCSTKAAYEISEHGTNWNPWSASDFGMSDVPPWAYEPYLDTAKKAIETGPFKASSGEAKHHGE